MISTGLLLPKVLLQLLQWLTQTRRRQLLLFLSAAVLIGRQFFQQRVQDLKPSLLVPRAQRRGEGKKASERGKKDASTEGNVELGHAFCALFQSAGERRGRGPQISVKTRSGRECHLRCFAEQRFAQLRADWGLCEERYWSSLANSGLRGGIQEPSGKSGSLFWISGDGLLVLKTTESDELRKLLQGLPRYEQHFATYKNSLLSRFFGAYELILDRRRVRLVVMNNTFACALQPHVVYDLKGTTEDRWVNPRPGTVLKDLNFADKTIGIPDLKQKAALLHILKRDTQFLRNQHVMDYSVCLGVHYCEENSYPNAELITPEPGISSSLAVLRGYEPKYQCTLVRNQPSQKVVFFIGIIDILQQFTWMKALAHTVKSLSLGWVHEIDTAPPAYYARRFKTSFCAKVQTFREPEDRVTRFVRRLRLGIENGTVHCPTFLSLERPRLETDAEFSADPTADVTLDEAVDFAVRRGGQLLVARRGLLRSRTEEVEAFLDMDRHALIFQEMARRPYARGRRPTSLVACYKIRRVYLTIVCYRPRDLYCMACRSHMKIEAEPPESRRFTVEADDEEPLRFTAPSRRQAKLWVTALEARPVASIVAAGYVEANVEDVREAQAAALVSSASGRPGLADGAFLSKPASAVRAALLGSLDLLLEEKELAGVLSTARQARHGLLEPYLLGPEAERRWQKRRLKWIFGFVDADGTGALSIEKINLLWHEMNINEKEGQQAGESGEWPVLVARLNLPVTTGDARTQDLAVLSGRDVALGAAAKSEAAKCCGSRTGQKCSPWWIAHMSRQSTGVCETTSTLAGQLHAVPVQVQAALVHGEMQAVGVHECVACMTGSEVTADDLAGFFAGIQGVWPPPSKQQVERLLARLPAPLTRQHSLSAEALVQMLCSPGNALVDPAKRSLFQDMTQPLCAYFVDTSHNTYLEGNQLSSRSSVLRYVEVLRAGCRSVEVDVWDGSNGEPVVKHGYTVTTEVLFQDVIQAIADHAFVASEFPVIISIEQHCCAAQRVRQGQIMSEVLGDQLLRPPWDEQHQCIDSMEAESISPWSARKRVLVKSSIGCCERCRRPLPIYDRCVALPTRKLLHKLVERELHDGSASPSAVSVEQDSSYGFAVASGTAAKVHKLEKSLGRDALLRWNGAHLSRVYPEGTRIGSGNVDPVPMWLCGVQMVAMNYQTSDTGLLLNEGFTSAFAVGTVFQGPTFHWARRVAPLGQRAEIVEIARVSHTRAVKQDGYHPVFDHEVELQLSDSPLHILTFEVFDAWRGRTMARSAVTLDAVRTGFRWLALHSPQGHSIPRCGLLLKCFLRPGSSITSVAFVRTGALQAWNQMLKVAPRSVLSGLWREVLQLVLQGPCGNGDADFGSLSNLRKLRVAVACRAGLVALPPRLAPWRYERGARSLLVNFAEATGGSAPIASAGVNVGSVNQDEDTEEDAPEEVEEVVELLLSALRDAETVVRWAAAKGVGRITNRLSRDFGDQVLESLLDRCFSFRETDKAWHGGCLALAELTRRGLLLPDRLPTVIPLICQALHFEQVSGNHAVGQHVRDAACYVCWAFARAYAPDVLQPYVEDLAKALIQVAVYDREINCRRAAAAAVQENVGRQGTFPDGIEVVTIADYWTLSGRRNAYLEVAPKIAALGNGGYRQSLIEHLVSRKLAHQDLQIRMLAAQGLARLASEPSDDTLSYLNKVVIPSLVERSTAEQASATATAPGAGPTAGTVQARHGAVEAVASLVEVLQEKVAAENQTAIRNLVPALEKARAYRGRGGEVIRQAACRLLQKIAATPWPFKDATAVRYLQTVDECARHTTEAIRVVAAEALGVLAAARFKPELCSKCVDTYLRGLQKADETIAGRRGHTLCLGAMPMSALAERRADVLTALCKEVQGADLPGGKDQEDPTTRQYAVLSLGCLCVGSTLSPEEMSLLLSALEAAMRDYATDRRGDVGSWVREVAMEVIVAILEAQRHQPEPQPALPDAACTTKLVSLLLQQASHLVSVSSLFSPMRSSFRRTATKSELLAAAWFFEAVEKIDRLRDRAYGGLLTLQLLTPLDCCRR
ncbi:TFCD [Symbiodinium natans]|uniref:TFCD protein n=1 Tax=Symbiodinium natans TaxID=878477 RepID=A0A812IHQ9_9DINO|nr:TFCD [Symbiodinium natans]